MLRRTVLVVAFIAAFFALPAADASPPDATKQSLGCVYASPAHDLPTNHTAPDHGPSAQRVEAVVSTGQRAADRASHGPLVRLDALGTCDNTTYDSTAQLVQVDNPGTPTAQLQRSHVAAKTAPFDEFWKLSNVGKNRPGTLVPESFDIATAGQKFSVHPNATKHMAEYARSTGTAPPISSLAGSIETAVARGLTPGRNFVNVGPWELGIDMRSNIIYHALYRP